jgi:hypothetical protein
MSQPPRFPLSPRAAFPAALAVLWHHLAAANAPAQRNFGQSMPATPTAAFAVRRLAVVPEPGGAFAAMVSLAALALSRRERAW